MTPPAAGGAPPARRLFFALWPGPGLAAALDGLAGEALAACGGRRVARESLHLTLAFLGAVPAARCDELPALAAGLAAAPFELCLDRLEWRRRQAIVWLAAGAVPAALAGLAGGLAAALRAAGLRCEDRPFAAHVTLLRKARCGAAPAPPAAPLVWPVREFVLAESALDRAGARYRIVGRWPLAA